MTSHSPSFKVRIFINNPDKSRLGELVNKKTASCLALTDFKEGQNELNNIARVCKEQFNNTLPQTRKPDQGHKSIMREKKNARINEGH
jgi:hypothetical protein